MLVLCQESSACKKFRSCVPNAAAATATESGNAAPLRGPFTIRSQQQPRPLLCLLIIMSFQDIESGHGYSPRAPSNAIPQSQEEAAFLTLQSSLSIQVLKINMNVQGILKLVDQLGTGKDSTGLRKSL